MYFKFSFIFFKITPAQNLKFIRFVTKIKINHKPTNKIAILCIIDPSHALLPRDNGFKEFPAGSLNVYFHTSR